MRFLKGCLAVCLACSLGSGCAFTKAMRPGFHQPVVAGEKIPLKVALVADEALRSKVYTKQDLIMFYRAKAGLGLAEALKADLDATFREAVVVESTAAVKGTDYVVTVGPEFPTTIKLAFSIPGAPEPTVVLQRPGLDPRKIQPALLLLFPLVAIAVPIMLMLAPSEAAAWRNKTTEALSKALEGLPQEILASRARLLEPVRMSGVEPALQAAEEAGRAGRREEAIARYREALARLPGGTLQEYELREKVIRYVLSLGAAPAVPEEARYRAERAQALVRQAQDAEGYGRAVAEFQQSLAAAPWWEEAYFNMGLLQEKLKDHGGAIRSLRLYLLAAPGAQDAEAVRRKIVDLEVAQELTQQ